MARAKKAVAAPVVAKRAYNRKPKELVFYVISKRTKLFSWTPAELYDDYDKALVRKRALEAESPLSIDGYKINTVTLVK